MLTAMAVSDNLIALKVAQDAGLEKMIDTAHKMGIQSELNPPEPRLVLGSKRVTLLEMTSAYGVLANHGIGNKPHIINRIIDISSPNCSRQNYSTDNDCRVLYAYDGDTQSGLKPDLGKNRRILSREIADQITELLKGVVADGRNGRPIGTASRVNIPEAAGKTGTSDKSRDLWFIGYIPEDLVTGVWIGNPAVKRAPTQAKSSDAAQIWQKYMKLIGY